MCYEIDRHHRCGHDRRRAHPTLPPPPPTARAPRVDWRIRFAVLSLVWGFSFLLIKVGTEAYAPFQVTFGRLLFGTAVLAAAMAVKRERLPRGARTWGHLTVAAFLLNALPFSLFAYAELTIPSTLAGICNATSPLWGMALSLVALSEDRPTRVRVAGLGLGFLGVLTVLGAWQGFSRPGRHGHGDGPAGLAQLSDRLDLRPPHTGRHRAHSHLSLTGAQLLLATLQLAVVTPLFTSLPDVLPGRARCSRSSRWAPSARASRCCCSTAWSPRSARRPPRWSRTSSRSSPRPPASRSSASRWPGTPRSARLIVLAGAALTQAGTGPGANRH